MTEPLTPADCDLTDFAFMPLDVARLFASEFHAVAADGEWRAGVTLWAKSWHQVPAGSLPDDDTMLARLAEFGRDTRRWRKVRAGALRGWIKAEDGRLYHPVVAEKALEAWLEKLSQRLSSGAGNAKRWGQSFDPGHLQADIERASGMLAALDPHSRALAKASRRQSRQHPVGTPGPHPGVIPSGSQGTGTGTGKGESSVPNGTGAEAPSDPDQRAWREAVTVLGQSGGMTEPAARKFFGKLLSDHGLVAKDLLASLAQTVANGTEDPRAYLRKAAEAVSKRRGGGSAAPAKPDEINWPHRLALWKRTDDWLVNSWGPKPGDWGCQCPAELLEDAA